jgi:Zinc finger C-x8-C-x5-C-x3-H type (and similar)
MNSYYINQPTRSVFWKTRICNKYVLNVCQFGDACDFAHGQHELRKLNIPIVNNTMTNTPKATTINLKHKTLLCLDFGLNGVCPRGDRCTFAHGQSELLSIPSSVTHVNESKSYLRSPALKRTKAVEVPAVDAREPPLKRQNISPDINMLFPEANENSDIDLDSVDTIDTIYLPQLVDTEIVSDITRGILQVSAAFQVTSNERIGIMTGLQTMDQTIRLMTYTWLVQACKMQSKNDAAYILSLFLNSNFASDSYILK